MTAAYTILLTNGARETVEGVQKIRAVDGTLCFYGPETPDTFIYGPLIRGYSLAAVVNWECVPESPTPVVANPSSVAFCDNEDCTCELPKRTK